MFWARSDLYDEGVIYTSCLNHDYYTLFATGDPPPSIQLVNPVTPPSIPLENPPNAPKSKGLTLETSAL